MLVNRPTLWTYWQFHFHIFQNVRVPKNVPKSDGLCQEISSPNDYHMLPALKQKLGSQKFKNDCEVKQL
jgi:hypothetical protein